MILIRIHNKVRRGLFALNGVKRFVVDLSYILYKRITFTNFSNGEM